MFIRIRAKRSDDPQQKYVSCTIDTKNIVFMAKENNDYCIYYLSMNNFIKVSEDTYSKLNQMIAPTLSDVFDVVTYNAHKNDKLSFWQKLHLLALYWTKNSKSKN